MFSKCHPALKTPWLQPCITDIFFTEVKSGPEKNWGPSIFNIAGPSGIWQFWLQLTPEWHQCDIAVFKWLPVQLLCPHACKLYKIMFRHEICYASRTKNVFEIGTSIKIVRILEYLVQTRLHLKHNDTKRGIWGIEYKQLCSKICLYGRVQGIIRARISLNITKNENWIMQ